MVGHSEWHRRLQRRFDQQQHGRTFCLWRLYNGDLHLYEQLCTNDDHLPSHVYGSSSATCGAHMPDTNNGQRMLDTDPA